VAKDGGFQVAQRWTWVDPEFVGEFPAHRRADRECIRLPTRAV
jgi:hypothetical protein